MAIAKDHDVLIHLRIPFRDLDETDISDEEYLEAIQEDIVRACDKSAYLVIVDSIQIEIV